MARRIEPSPSPRTGRAADRLLYPLDLAYAWAGVAPPEARALAPGRVPQPYRGLLAHERDMTGTLERHFGTRLTIRVLSARVGAIWYVRRVVLVQRRTGRPVAMCAVRVKLGRAIARTAGLTDRVRSVILRGEVPLGRALLDAGHEYVSRPRVFFGVTPNPEMLGVFWMPAPRRLYGRRSEMRIAGATFGDVIEVLAPI